MADQAVGTSVVIDSTVAARSSGVECDAEDAFHRAAVLEGVVSSGGSAGSVVERLKDLPKEMAAMFQPTGLNVDRVLSVDESLFSPYEDSFELPQVGQRIDLVVLRGSRWESSVDGTSTLLSSQGGAVRVWVSRIVMDGSVPLLVAQVVASTNPMTGQLEFLGRCGPIWNEAVRLVAAEAGVQADAVMSALAGEGETANEAIWQDFVDAVTAQGESASANSP